MANTRVFLRVSKHPDPSKPNHLLVGTYITETTDKEPPAKHVIFLADNNRGINVEADKNKNRIINAFDHNKRSEGRSLAYVNGLADSLIRSLAINKDSFSLMQFDSTTRYPMPSQLYRGSDQTIEFVARHGYATNVAVGLETATAISQIDQQNLDNTLIVLLLAGPITEGSRDPQEIINNLKLKLDNKSVRIVPVGIGNDYPIDFMKKIAEETGCKGYIHVDDKTDPKIIVEKVKSYLLPEKKVICVDLDVNSDSHYSDTLELTRVGSNFSASNIWEIAPISSEIININYIATGYTDSGDKHAITDLKYILQRDNIEYDPEIVEKYFTGQYLEIVYNTLSDNKITKLRELLERLNQLKLDQHKIINDFKLTVEQTITFLHNSSQSEFRNVIANVFNNYYKFSDVGSVQAQEISAAPPAASTNPHDSNLANATRVTVGEITGQPSASSPLVSPPIPTSTTLSSSASPSRTTSDSTSAIELASHSQKPSSVPINKWLYVMPRIKSEYEHQCGFFHWRSKESLKLLEATAEGTVFDESYSQNASRRQTLIMKYLADSNNKGKRLYDILLEQKIKFDQAQQKSAHDGVSNSLWLNDDILYLIQNSYTKKRGFKFFGYTCEASSALLKYLQDGNSLMQKQQAIENYLNPENDEGEITNQGKRLFIILSMIKEKFALVADQDLSRKKKSKK